MKKEFDDMGEHAYELGIAEHIARTTYCICGHLAEEHGFNGCEGDNGTCFCSTFREEETPL